MSRIRDVLLEIRIWWAKECAMSCVKPSEARDLWRNHARLIGLRSAAQVERMETRMGIR